jgi:tripartite-type tricarboxylate transporter receptor subunit TctC
MDMRIDRRRLAQIALALASAPLSIAARAQSWPGRPVRVVYPYAGGGVGDAMFRFLEGPLRQKFGQAFFIDIKAGAGGNIGAAEVARAAPDGQTLLMAPTANYSVNQYLFKLGFDPLAQFEPIATVANAPLLAVVGPEVPATSLRQLADLVRAPGGRFNYGSPGAGSPTHLAGASFALANGNTMEHIAFKGTAPMVQSMLAGDVQLAFPTLTPVLGQLKAGRLRALAVLARQRLPELPDVPSVVEAGFPDLVFGNWWMLAAPRGTDATVVARLGAEVRQLLADPAIQAKFAEIGHVPLIMSPAESAAFVRAEAAKFKTLIERTGIRIE